MRSEPGRAGAPADGPADGAPGLHGGSAGPALPAAVTAVLPILEGARARGLLGPGPVSAHVAHAIGFAGACPGPPAGPAVDLGSGGGIPGLPLALLWPDSRWALMDASTRRTAFLREAVSRLDLGHRVEVVQGRAEDIGREAARRGRFALVVARSFGPPAVVAECGCPLLAVGGRMVVSEPPDVTVSRWPAAGLAVLGAAPGPRARAAGGTYQALTQVSPCPDRFPRRSGMPAKRPLF